MKHIDHKYWWEDLPEALSAYGEVCGRGWRGIKGTGIEHLYDRFDIDGLFISYYALVAAIEDYISTVGFQRKYEKSIKEL
jgi:hypothetical protein